MAMLKINHEPIELLYTTNVSRQRVSRIKGHSQPGLYGRPESLITLPHRQIADVASNLMMREG
jgi:hypothetical protein